MSSDSSITEMDLPPGFRFTPTDKVLLSYYLTNKLASINITGEQQQQQQQFYNLEVVVESSVVYSKHPWNLAKDDTDASHRMERDGALYYFVHMMKKNANGCRPNRKILDMGFWKATSSGKEVVDDHGNVIGIKRNLVYHKFKDGKKTSSKDGSKTSWIMHEYHLVDPTKNPDDDKKEFQEWVLCRISNSGRHPSSITNDSTSMPEAAALSFDHDDQVPCTSIVPHCGDHPAATDQTPSTTLHHQQLLGKQKQHPLIAPDDEAAYSMASINNETNQVVEVEEDSSMFESFDVFQQYTTTLSIPFGEGCSYNYSHMITNTSPMLEAAVVYDHDQVPCTSIVPHCGGHPAATDQTPSTTLHHQQLLGKQKQHPLIAPDDEAAYSMAFINNETNQVVEVEEDSSMFESFDVVQQYMTTPSVPLFPFVEDCSCNYSHLITNTSSMLEATALSSDHDDQVSCTSIVPHCGGHPAATDQTLSTTLHHQQLLGKRKQHPLIAPDDEAAYSMVSINNETNQVVEVEEDSSMFESFDVDQYMTTLSVPFGERCSYNYSHRITNASSMLEATALSSDHDDQVPSTSIVPHCGGHPAAPDQTLSTTLHHQQLLGKRKQHPLIATDDEAYSMVSINNETIQVVEVDEDSSTLESLVHQFMTTPYVPFGEGCSYN